MSARSKAEILIVDDEPNTLAALSRTFRLEGFEATVADNAVRGLELARSRGFDLILSDVVMPNRDGLLFLEDLRNNGINSPVVMMSGQAHIDMAVRATKLGAMDFLEKPISTEKLLLTLENALKFSNLERENRELRTMVGKHEIVWQGDAMRRVMTAIERVAASETRVCIYGETGTGKELAARTLHQKSQRSSGPFITLNCAAVPAELIESELFGHEKGSFTGATNRHLGKFEQAHRGTLFLDEIGDMPLPMQAKLLRVLEEGEVERVGGDHTTKVDVRVIVATHRNLEELVKQGTFRQDLFHRIFVFPLTLPALRDRREDIPLLVEHFARQISALNGWKPTTFSPEAIALLQNHSWPGNIRELRNVVERLLLFAGTDGVDRATVELAVPNLSAQQISNSESAATGPLASRVAQFERESILAELKRNNHHVTNTAKALGLERSHLYKKCQQLGINLRDQ